MDNECLKIREICFFGRIIVSKLFLARTINFLLLQSFILAKKHFDIPNHAQVIDVHRVSFFLK